MGNVGFAVAESMTLILSIATYFYLRRNFSSYPPLRVSTARLDRADDRQAIFLLTCIPAYVLKKSAISWTRARRRDGS